MADRRDDAEAADHHGQTGEPDQHDAEAGR